MVYYVAIPTYNRSDVIASKTLAFLKGKVDSEHIYLFVANAEEQTKYKDAVPAELYNKIVVGKLGITNQRRFIKDYFAEGAHVVSIDDDIDGLYRLNAANDGFTEIRNVDSFVRKAFERLAKERLYLWGVYPVKNPFFMSRKSTTDLRFIIGMFHGYINRKNVSALEPSTKSESKEDIEMSVLYYLRDGGVLRFTDVAVKSKPLSAGGLGELPERLAKNNAAACYLEKTYPTMLRMYFRDNGKAELRVLKQPNTTTLTHGTRKNKSPKSRRVRGTKK